MEESLIRLLAFAAAIVPSFVVLWYFLVASVVRPDTELIWDGFAVGACTAFPAILFAALLKVSPGEAGADGSLALGATQAFRGAAIPEEICKFIALLCLCGPRLRELRPQNLFLIAIAIACGFACLENVFYVVQGEGWQGLAIKRSVSAVPGHAFMGAVMGYCLVRGVQHYRTIWWGLALLLPIALHGAYNFPLFALENISKAKTAFSTDLIDALVVGFIVIVLLEGIVAHLCLRAVSRIKGPREQSWNGPPESALGEWSRILQTPLPWSLIGLVCVLAGLSLLLGPAAMQSGWAEALGAAELGFHQGIGIFAFLHGIAFLSLARITSNRRRYQTGNRPI